VKKLTKKERIDLLIEVIGFGYVKGYMRAVTGLEGDELEAAAQQAFACGKKFAEGAKKRGTVRGCYKVRAK
jgi:hypothetical protein